MTRPTILLIHGAWHQPDSYDDFLTVARNAGYYAVCPGLPTLVSNRKPREQDSSLVTSIIEPLLEDRRELLIVAHSYGGLVASEAIGEKHTLAHRRANGLKGGVIQILYFTSFILPPGVAIPDIMQINRDSMLDIDLDDDRDTCRPKNPREAFYGDVKPKKKLDHAVSLLVDHSLSVSWAPASQGVDDQGLAWMHVPSTYVYCDEDNTITLKCQKEMVKKAKELGAKFDREIKLKSSHSPFLSQPERCLEIVEEACEKAHKEGSMVPM